MKKGEIAAHFSGDFNVYLLILTTFSSVFSGYTVIGVPTEARAMGFFAVRWVGAIICIAIAMSLYFPRMRRLAKVRGYQSPNDFLADRYRSKVITVLGSLCTCLPQLFYLTVQLVSFAGLLNGLTAGAVPNLFGMVLFAAIVLTLERIGGMNSVVLSDSVQAVLMVVGFVLIYIVVGNLYGTLADLAAADCPTLGYVNETAKQLLVETSSFETRPSECTRALGPADPDCVAFGCIPHAEFSGPGKPAYFWFLFNFIAFPLNPHMVQRATISRSDEAVKTTIQLLCFASFLTMIPGIVVGIVAATFSPSWPISSSSAGAFAAVSNELKDMSLLLYCFVALLTCAALAAIMSTADSVILGVSNALSIDIYRGVIRPEASPEDVVNIGNWVSLIFTGVSLVLGLFVTSAGFGTLLTLQNGIILQIVPAFFCGLFFEDISVTALQAGLISGLVMLPIFYFLVPLSPWIPAPNLCILINLVVIAAVQRRHMADGASIGSSGAFQETARKRFEDDALTVAKIQEYLKFDVEPSLRLTAVGSVLFFVSFPFLYDIETTDLVPGIGWPAWSLHVLVFSFFTAAVMAAALSSWRPGPLPSNKSPITNEAADVDEIVNHGNFGTVYGNSIDQCTNEARQGEAERARMDGKRPQAGKPMRCSGDCLRFLGC